LCARCWIIIAGILPPRAVNKISRKCFKLYSHKPLPSYQYESIPSSLPLVLYFSTVYAVHCYFSTVCAGGNKGAI
jgi:hypothetical protein